MIMASERSEELAEDDLAVGVKLIIAHASAIDRNHGGLTEQRFQRDIGATGYGWNAERGSGISVDDEGSVVEPVRSVGCRRDVDRLPGGHVHDPQRVQLLVSVEDPGAIR